MSRRRRWTGLSLVVGVILAPSPCLAAQANDAAAPDTTPKLEAASIESSAASTMFPVGPAAAATWNAGSLRLAMAETLLGNFIPWLAAEYLTDHKDITRISPTTWRTNLEAGAVWDDNHFYVNMLLHPYQGNFYFNAGRSNGYNFEKSFLFTLMGSALWECCGESHHISKSDLITTTLGGTTMGEVFYRWGSQALEKNQIGWTILAGVLTPSRAFTRWVLDRPQPPPPNIAAWEAPSVPAPILINAGLSVADSGTGAFVEIRSTYDSLTHLTWRTPPFSHFESLIQLSLRDKEVIGRAQIRGNLWPLPSYRSTNVYLGATSFLGLDYVNNYAFEFGGESIGLAGALAWIKQAGPYFALSANAHLLFGGVDSEFARLGEIHDLREREREYDFAFGPGWGASLVASPWSWLRASGYYRWNRHNVLDGSNVDGYDSEHDTRLLGFSVAFPRLFLNWGLGVDGSFFDRTSRYDNPALTPTVIPGDTRYRFYLTYQTRDRPPSLFVF